MRFFSAALVVLAVLVFAGWRVWSRANGRPASEALHQKIKVLVDKKPDLRPSYDRAMEDGVLTIGEARAILDERHLAVGSPFRRGGQFVPPPGGQEES